MNQVAQRTFRIRQTAPKEVIAEELVITSRRGWFGRVRVETWWHIDYTGELNGYSKHGSIEAARQAIRDRKERLLRADEFPKVIEAYEWDGLPDLRSEAAGWSSR